MTSELQLIEKHSKVTATQCDCHSCVGMCKTAVCIGTPEDIARLILAGYIDKLSLTLWAAGEPYGIKERVNMVQLHYDEEKKRCCMLDENNKCRLHADGLKPIEGKLATCKLSHYTKDHTPPSLIVAASWIKSYNLSLVLLIIALINEYMETGKLNTQGAIVLRLLLSQKENTYVHQS